MRHTTYEIHVRGDLPPALLAELDGATSRRGRRGDGAADARHRPGEPASASAYRLRDLGIELVEMRRAAANPIPRQAPRESSPRES